LAVAFEWSSRKEAANKRKHGVSFPEARTVFDDSLAKIMKKPAKTNSPENARTWHLNTDLTILRRRRIGSLAVQGWNPS
jgi:uncharacterized DUF497 family protein